MNKLKTTLLPFIVFFSGTSFGQNEHKPQASDFVQPIMKAIAYGITAPNAHNTQMWMIDTISENEMDLYVKHALPETDPPGRQVMISAGCFIELMKIGLSNEGYGLEVDYLPEGDIQLKPSELSSKPVATLRLVKSDSVQKDPLFEYIYQRQSNRSKFKGKMITHQEFEQIQKLTGPTHTEMIFVNDKEEMKPYLDIFSKAMEIETRNKATNEETRKWFRFGEKQITQKKDGLSLQANGLKGLMLKFAEKSLKNGDSTTWHSEKSMKAVVRNIDKAVYSSKGLIFFKTETNTKTDWLKTGRDFARYNISVAKLGLATSHFNQVIQEYPQMNDLQNEFRTLIGTKEDEKIQLILRIGRADMLYKSWRRDVESFIIQH